MTGRLETGYDRRMWYGYSAIALLVVGFFVLPVLDSRNRNRREFANFVLGAMMVAFVVLIGACAATTD